MGFPQNSQTAADPVCDWGLLRQPLRRLRVLRETFVSISFCTHL